MALTATTAFAEPLLILGKDGNLLVNGDFSDDLNNWSSSATSPAVGSASNVNGELFYDVISDSGTLTQLQASQQDFLLKTGLTYRLTFSARASANRTLRANVRSVSLGGYLNFNVELTPNMTTFTTTFTSTKATINDTRLTFYMGAAGDADVWLDNVSLTDVSLEGVITTGPSWFWVGDQVAVQPPANGTLYLAKIRQDYTEYTNAVGAFDEAGYAAHAAITMNVMAADVYHLDTAALVNGAFNQISGSYEVLLVANGVVQAVQPFHLAFTDRPISPHYEVSVRTSGSAVFTDLATYFSYRVSEYIRDGGGDGMNVEVENISNAPVNAHSWAGISTADYPITVRVRVLPAAQDQYFDGTTGVTLPLSSARVLPSSYGIPCTVENGDTIVFTLDRPEKVMVIPNYNEVMTVFNNRAAGHVPLASFEDKYTSNSIPPSFKADRASDLVSEGYKNPLVFLGRLPDTFPTDLGFSKNAPDTLVVHPKDQPTQAQLSAARVVWFEPGNHDLSRLGVRPSYRTYINAGQIFYLEEGAFVAAGFKKNEATGTADCHLIGRGVVSGINHVWGGGSYEMNSLAVEVDIVDGLNFVDRANWGIDGGDLIRDISLLGAWHGNCDGLDSLDHCTVLDSFLERSAFKLRRNLNCGKS